MEAVFSSKRHGLERRPSDIQHLDLPTDYFFALS